MMDAILAILIAAMPFFNSDTLLCFRNRHRRHAGAIVAIIFIFRFDIVDWGLEHK